MSRVRGLCLSGTLLATLLIQAVPAHAELYKDVARGLALLDYRFSGERNVLGDGITVNANAVYNNRDFNFGVADLKLNGVVNASAGFTRRGIPGADFSLNTGTAPLSYTFKTDNIGQTLSATGQVLINVDSHINALGFYTQTLEISNRGTYTTTGLAGDTTGPLAFDVGPINVSGNVYGDILAAVTQPFFAASGLENPFGQLSQQASKLASATKTVQDLEARAMAGEQLSDQEMSALINNSILAAILGGKPDSKLFNDLMLPPGLLESKDGLVSLQSTPTPEPASMATLALILAAGLQAFRRRRS